MIQTNDLAPPVREAVRDLENAPVEVHADMLRLLAVEHIHASLVMCKVSQWSGALELISIAAGFITAAERATETDAG